MYYNIIFEILIKRQKERTPLKYDFEIAMAVIKGISKLKNSTTIVIIKTAK